jgi:hypothetical protein
MRMVGALFSACRVSVSSSGDGVFFVMVTVIVPTKADVDAGGARPWGGVRSGSAA